MPRRRAVKPSVIEPRQAAVGEQFAGCRALGHEWKHSKKPMRDAVFGWIGFYSWCDDCGTKRTKWMSSGGVLMPTKYDYPKDYSQHGEDRYSTLDWRRTYVVSVMDMAS